MRIRRNLMTLTLVGALALAGAACEETGQETEDVTPELDEGTGEEGVIEDNS